MIERSIREQKASDESKCYENWTALRERYSHIFNSPNTNRYRQTFETLLYREAPGKRILEIGCGTGELSARLADAGAISVFGADISHRFITTAQELFHRSNCSFAVTDVSQPVEGSYDLIFGRAVLHHLDYQEVMSRLYENNLNAGGIMIFSEPLGENALMRLFRHFSKHAHTDDERAFDRYDLRWMEQRFDMTLIPGNYLTIPFGALSSLVFKSPDNWLLRLADRADVFLARYAKWLHERFRYAILVIRKPH